MHDWRGTDHDRPAGPYSCVEFMTSSERRYCSGSGTLQIDSGTLHREKFGKAKPEDESGLQYAARLSGYFDRWVEMSQTDTSYAGLRELFLCEQFLKGSQALRIFLKEKRCKTLRLLSKIADNFTQAQALSNNQRVPKKTAPVEPSKKSEPARKIERTSTRFLYEKTGHREADCWSGTKGTAPVRCEKCHRNGHSSDQCPRKFDKGQASCVNSVGQAWKLDCRAA